MTSKERYYKSKAAHQKKRDELEKKKKKTKKDIGPISGVPQNGPSSGLIGNF